MLAAATCRPSRIEIRSQGFDPSVCCMGSDPSGSMIADGLRVPTLATSSAATRYLFQLATIDLPVRGTLWLVGLMQLLTIWEDTAAGTPPVAPVEKLIGRAGAGNPLFSFTDSSVSWHLRFCKVKPKTRQGNPLNSESFVYQWSDAPALVYQTATFNAQNLNGNGSPDNYTALTAYTPPYNGQPPGTSVAGLGTFNGVRFPWDAPGTQMLEPVALKGPGTLVFWASVWQTNPATRAAVTIPASFPVDPQLPEAGMISDFTSSIYGRVGGGFALERSLGPSYRGVPGTAGGTQ